MDAEAGSFVSWFTVLDTAEDLTKARGRGLGFLEEMGEARGKAASKLPSISVEGGQGGGDAWAVKHEDSWERRRPKWR
jgi:hypothetical protein